MSYSVKKNFHRKHLSIEIFLDEVPVIITSQTHYSLVALKSNTTYHVKIQYITEQGDSRPSDPTTFRTEDECKGLLNLFFSSEVL